MNHEDLIGRHIAEVDTPALLLDLDALERNIARMRDLVVPSGIAYRPHAKSNKCPEVARLQLAAGACGICCAKLAEAEAMAAGGIGDILITTPIVGVAKIARLAALARRAHLRVVADNAANIEALSSAAARAGVTIGIVVEVNVGQDRCGVEPGPAAARLAVQAAGLAGLSFAGLQGYNGRIQGLAEFAARATQVERSLDRLRAAAAHVRKAGMEIAVLTGGGTGSAAIDIALSGLTELQPGSYVFMDTSYARVVWDSAGARMPFEHALSVMASVVSRPAAGRAVLDVGWKSISADSGPPALRHLPGLAFEFAGDEHATIKLAPGGSPDSWSPVPGDRVELLPSHCDTTVNLYDRYVVHRDDRVVDLWAITARGKSQ
jgi:D-serine deaminase-like pyridoxal phosphate-dependent protein